MIFRVVYKSWQIFLSFCHNARVWQMDRRTPFSSLVRAGIPCSAENKILFNETRDSYKFNMANLNRCRFRTKNFT